MSQSKRHSAVETATNTAVGFVGSYFITFACFHVPGADLATKTLYATLGCTVWSLLRGYYLRRMFNHLHTKQAPPLSKLERAQAALYVAPDSEPPKGADVESVPLELLRQIPDQTPCPHLFVDGFGQMGDALTCCKCGLSKYPEALPKGVLELAQRQGRIITTNNPEYDYYADLARAASRKH